MCITTAASVTSLARAPQAGSTKAMLRLAAQSTTVATDDQNPTFEERFEVRHLRKTGRLPSGCFQLCGKLHLLP